MKKYVKVPLERIKDLLSAEATLNELEGAGVDNWQGIEECGALYIAFSDEDVPYTIFEG